MRIVEAYFTVEISWLDIGFGYQSFISDLDSVVIVHFILKHVEQLYNVRCSSFASAQICFLNAPDLPLKLSILSAPFLVIFSYC